jgi:hypothetical protein
VTAHHLPYHPRRLRQGNADAAAAAVAAAMRRRTAGERVAVLDLRPGRTASFTYRRAMAACGGSYLAPPRPGAVVNLRHARTVLSLGAPLLDGWCAPSRAFAARDRFRLIQAEPVESRTAVLADLWLPIAAGSEDALVLALAGRIPAAEAAEHTGLNVRQIEGLAGELRDNGPALVIDPGMSENVVALNVALGSWGKTVVKTGPDLPSLPDVPDGSVRVLLIDESLPGGFLPWREIEKKLVADNPVVVAFAFSRDGYARHATHALPAPVFPEITDDVAPPVDSTAPMFRLVAPLIPALEGTVNPVQFVAKLAGFDASNALRERADAIHAAGHGTLVGESTPLRQMTADDFWKALNAGGCWVGEEPKSPAPKVEFEALTPRETTGLVAVAAERAIPDSPLLSKLYRESNLMLGPGRIAMHPDDARTRGLANGAQARLEVASESQVVEVVLDAKAPPGVVLTAGAAGVAKVVRI